MSVAEHRTRDCAQYHARAKSQPGLGTGRNGKGQSDHAKDGNRPGAHDRSPADCRTLLNGRVWIKRPSLAKFPLRRSATVEIPNGRMPPSAFGISTRCTGGGK